MIRAQYLFSLAAAGALSLAASAAFASPNVDLVATPVSPATEGVVLPGSEITFKVALDNNATAFEPGGASFQVNFNPLYLEFVEVTSIDPDGPGDILVSAVAASSNDIINPVVHARDISVIVATDPSNPLTELDLCTIKFRVKRVAGVGSIPVDIAVVADSETTSPVPYFQLIPPAVGSLVPAYIGDLNYNIAAGSPIALASGNETVLFDLGGGQTAQFAFSGATPGGEVTIGVAPSTGAPALLAAGDIPADKLVITGSGLGSFTGTLTWVLSSTPVVTPTSVYRVNGGVISEEITAPAFAYNAGTQTITVTGVTAFSDWYAGESGLPVELDS